MKKLLWIAGIMVLMAGVAQAVPINWDSGGDPDTEWSNADNWATTYVPGNNGETDRADFFSVGDTATVSSDVSSANKVDIHMRFNGNITISANMTDIGNIDIGIDGFTPGFGTFIKQNAGTVTAAGALAIGTDDTNGGLYELSGTGTLDLAGLTTVGANGKVSIIGSTASFAAAADFTMLTTGILDFQFDAAGVGAIDGVGVFTVDSTSSVLTIDGSAYTGGDADFTLLNADSMVGTFDSANYTVTGMGNEGSDWTLTQGTNGDLVLNVTPQPEPLTFTWNNPADASSSWATVANWLTNGVAAARAPASGDSVILNATTTSEGGSAWVVGPTSFTIESGQFLIANEDGTRFRPNGGSLTVATGGTFDLTHDGATTGTYGDVFAGNNPTLILESGATARVTTLDWDRLGENEILTFKASSSGAVTLFQVDGAVKLDDTDTVLNLDLTAMTAGDEQGTYELIDYDSISGTFTTVNVTGLELGQAASIDYAYDLGGGDLGVAVTVVPEPATIGILGM